MHICTSITGSHLPWARVLAASFAERHPAEPPLVVLVADDEGGLVDGGNEPFRVLRPADIGIDRAEMRLRAAMYPVMQFSGSTRAPLLAALLDETGGEPVLYLDADVYVTGSLEPLAGQVSAAGVVLSPHLTGPPPSPLPIERDLLRAGTYNAGYIAVAGDAGRRFAAWWGGHVARWCLSAPERGFFGSQRWLDLAPSLFDVAMLRDAGSNVTVHNLGDRRVERAGGGWTIDGAPLRFLHVSGGFDPRAVEWPELSLQPSVTELCREYGARLVAAGHRSPPDLPYAYAASRAGVPMDPWVRDLCHRAVLAGEPFPDPFDAEHAVAFTEWLAEPVAGSDPPVSRWALALRDWRADLRAVFPGVPGRDDAALLNWVARQRDHPVPAAFATTPTEPPEERARRDEAKRAADAFAALRGQLDGVAAELAATRAERDDARADLERLRASRLLRGTRVPRRIWYRLRG